MSDAQLIYDLDDSWVGACESHHEAALIVAAVNGLPGLLDEVERLRRASGLLDVLDAVYEPGGVEKWLAHHANQLHAIDEGNYL